MTSSLSDSNTDSPVVLVFEAGSESGSELVHTLLASGCRVVATDLYATHLARMSNGYSADRVYLVAADPTDPRQLDRLLERARRRFGCIDSMTTPGVARPGLQRLGLRPNAAVSRGRACPLDDPRRQHRCADSGRSSAR